MLALYLAYLDDAADKEKFEEMFMSYRKQMIRQAMDILRNENDAEDAVHNVFLKIARSNWETVKKIENSTDLRNYLLKATKNTSFNMQKAKHKESVSLDTVEEYDISGTVNTSDEDFITEICQKMEYETVIDAIKSLNGKYREALYYHFVMEIPVNKTAKLLGQTVSATQKQLVRGKKLLLNSLGTKELTKDGDKQR